MERIDINGIIEKFKYVLKQHELGTGQYCRFLWQDALETRKMGLNAYGCADAANIMYTLGELPRNTAVRENFINTLQDLQNPKTGLFLNHRITLFIQRRIAWQHWSFLMKGLVIRYMNWNSIEI